MEDKRIEEINRVQEKMVRQKTLNIIEG